MNLTHAHAHVGCAMAILAPTGPGAARHMLHLPGLLRRKARGSRLGGSFCRELLWVAANAGEIIDINHARSIGQISGQ